MVMKIRNNPVCLLAIFLFISLVRGVGEGGKKKKGKEERRRSWDEPQRLTRFPFVFA